MFDFEFSRFVFDFEFSKFVFNFEFFGGKKKPINFLFFKPITAFFKNAAIGLQPITMIINVAQSGSIATFFKNTAIGPKPIVVVF